VQIIRQSKKGLYLVTIVIGESYVSDWVNIVKENWLHYCEKYEVGIIIFIEDLLPKSNPYWKKANWQKLLISKQLIQSDVNCNYICYLDSDIIISPFAPNIFDWAISNKVGVVSARKNMPYDYFEINKRLAYLRRKFLDTAYRLDSAQHFSTRELYDYHSFPDQGDEFCSGVLLFSPTEMNNYLEEWFYLYKSDVRSITAGGEQTHLNYHIFSNNLAHLLPYKFQAIWAFEVAWSHIRLFEGEFLDKKSIKESVIQVVLNNHFVHFAGNQIETSKAFDKEVLNTLNSLKEWQGLDDYLRQKVITKPL